MDGPGASNLAGSAQLDGVASSGTLGTAPGTINLANWKNAAGDVLPSQLVPLLSFLRLSDGAQVLTLSNQITSANPVAPALSITHANLVPGAWYMACAWNADGSIAGIEPYQAA